MTEVHVDLDFFNTNCNKKVSRVLILNQTKEQNAPPENCTKIIKQKILK